MEGKEIKVVFKDNLEDIHFINVFNVLSGNDDYFVRLGYAIPPSATKEDLEKVEEIEAKTLFTFAMTKSTMKEFIRLLQEEYEEDE